MSQKNTSNNYNIINGLPNNNIKTIKINNSNNIVQDTKYIPINYHENYPLSSYTHGRFYYDKFVNTDNVKK